jgi:hypothetical protein
MQRLGRIDILVNNAGATWGAPAEDYPLEAWDKVMNLNIRSLFLFAQAVAKASMIPNKYGRIINIASIAGLAGSLEVKFIAYGTSKGAAVNFTRTLAAEWGPYGITVNALAPGFFPSKMTKGVLEHFGVDKLAGRAAEAHGRRRRPEGRRAAVCQRGRQAHHRADPGGGRRRQRGARRLSGPSATPATAVPAAHPLRRRTGAGALGLCRWAGRVARGPGRGAPQQLGRGARRRADDDAGRGHGHAARSANGQARTTAPAWPRWR